MMAIFQKALVKLSNSIDIPYCTKTQFYHDNQKLERQPYSSR